MCAFITCGLSTRGLSRRLKVSWRRLGESATHLVIRPLQQRSACVVVMQVMHVSVACVVLVRAVVVRLKHSALVVNHGSTPQTRQPTQRARQRSRQHTTNPSTNTARSSTFTAAYNKPSTNTVRSSTFTAAYNKPVNQHSALVNVHGSTPQTRQQTHSHCITQNRPYVINMTNHNATRRTGMHRTNLMRPDVIHVIFPFTRRRLTRTELKPVVFFRRVVRPQLQ